MIYIFYGDKVAAKLAAKEQILRGLEGREILELSDLEFDLHQLENFAGSESLFGAKRVVIMSGILEDAERRQFIEDRLKLLSQSETVFIFLDQKLTKSFIEVAGKVAEEIKEFSELKKTFLEKNNPFALANALTRRDKKGAWLELAWSTQNDNVPEATAGLLFWKVKKMILDKDTKKFSQAELENLSGRLVRLYHDAHRGRLDLATGLEQFVLESL